MATSPLENAILQDLLKAGGKVVVEVGTKAAARALESVLSDAERVIKEGSRRVKKARGRLRRIAVEPVEPQDDPEDDDA